MIKILRRQVTGYLIMSDGGLSKSSVMVGADITHRALKRLAVKYVTKKMLELPIVIMEMYGDTMAEKPLYRLVMASEAGVSDD